MPTGSQSIQAAIDIRTRYMRHVRENRSAAQRLADFARLQEGSFRVLRQSPHGYQYFLRRNLASRRAEVIDGVWKPVSPARRAQQP
ncbi:MAG TPA: hypothetical protein PLF81_11955 [Candidatus Anammoximicrobium sp.]|nr:hypothetical protein [Candidatus Anammoximicrobium sp.]